MRALVTFKHQLVYCPLTRKQVRLNPPTPEVTPEQLQHAGTEVDPQVAWQLALGNCDPFSMEKLHNYDPDKVKILYFIKKEVKEKLIEMYFCLKPRKLRSAWSETAVAKHTSIWSSDFKIKAVKERKSKTVIPNKEKQLPASIASTRGQVVTLKTDALKQLTPRKRTFEGKLTFYILIILK